MRNGLWVTSVSDLDRYRLDFESPTQVLGHTNLSTTSRYLNIHRRGLQMAMQKLEEYRPAVAQALHTPQQDAQASVPPSQEQPAPKAHVVQ